VLLPRALTSAFVILALSHLSPRAEAVVACPDDPCPPPPDVAPSAPSLPPPPQRPAPPDENFNGIVAGEPKIYDDRSLDQMLQAYQAQLAQLKAFDNPTLINRIGTLQGATSQQSSFAAQATGRPTLDLSSTVTTGGANAGTQTVAKQPSITPAVPGITDTGTGALPSSFSTSASDALGEEAQLAFEIANLRLLLQESLSDRYVNGSLLTKRSVTVGIPISIEPIRGSENAVAEVEIAVTTTGSTTSPGVITLLPREKTYNVAALKDSSVSLGAGAVIANVVNVGFNWFGRKQAYYLVKAFDTVAMQRATQQPATTVLAWQFLPVLGEKTVKPGLRQVFVRLAFPASGVAGDLGTVWVKTTWRHYDAKSGVVGSSKCTKVWSQSYTLSDVGRFAKGSLTWSDLGTGQVVVVESASFPPGTSVLLPEGYLADGSPNFQLDSKHLIFNLSTAQLVREKVGSLVSIFGNECDLITACNPAGLPNAEARIHGVSVQPFNASQSMVTVQLEDGDVTNYKKEPPLVLLNKHVIGLRDAPFYAVKSRPVNNKGEAGGENAVYREWQEVSFLAANDDLRQAHNLELAHPFCGSSFYDIYPFNVPGDFIAAQATTLSTGDTESVIAVSGQNLTGVSVLVNGIPATQAPTPKPGGPARSARHAVLVGHLASIGRGSRQAAPAPCNPSTLDATYAPTMLLLHIPTCLASGLKSIAVARPQGETTVLALDTGNPKPTIKQPDPLPQVAAGARKVLKLTGTNLGLIQDVQFNGATLQPAIAPDLSYISIVLPDAIGTVPGFYLLTALASDKAKTQIPVVVTISAPPKPGA
jgi:hypothetical protein